MSQRAEERPTIRSTAAVIAASIGFCAFALAVAQGVHAGNDASVVLWRALVAMFTCQLLGMLIGKAAETAIGEHLESYRAAHTARAAQVGRAPQTEQMEQTAPSEGVPVVEKEDRAAA